MGLFLDRKAQTQSSEVPMLQGQDLVLSPTCSMTLVLYSSELQSPLM